MPSQSEQTDAQQRDKYFEIVFRLALLLALVSAIAVAITYADVLELPGNFEARYLIVAALLQLILWLLSTYSWQRVVMLSSGIKLPFKDCFAQVALLLVGKYIPGKIWGLIARIHHLKKFDVEVNSSIHATYLEQLNSLHVGIVFGIACWLMALGHEWRWLFLVFGLSSLIIVPMCHKRIFRYLFNITPFSWRSRLQIYAVIDMPVGDYLLIACLYFMEWLLSGIIAVSIFIVMIGIIPSFNLAAMLIGSNAVALVTGFIALFAPAGIGVREIVNAEMLLSALTLAEITGFVILLRCWSVSTDIILGGLVLLCRKEKSYNTN